MRSRTESALTIRIDRFMSMLQNPALDKPISPGRFRRAMLPPRQRLPWLPPRQKARRSAGEQEREGVEGEEFCDELHLLQLHHGPAQNGGHAGGTDRVRHCRAADIHGCNVRRVDVDATRAGEARVVVLPGSDHGVLIRGPGGPAEWIVPLQGREAEIGNPLTAALADPLGADRPKRLPETAMSVRKRAAFSAGSGTKRFTYAPIAASKT